MPFLLDTNIVSETVKTKPEQTVLTWLQEQIPSELFLTSLTIGELVRGTQKPKEKARRDRLVQWIEEDLCRQFEGQILGFDDAAARVWGRLMGEGDRNVRTPSAADTQIAAVAVDRQLVLVTRNIKDFKKFDLDLLNPWEADIDG